MSKEKPAPVPDATTAHYWERLRAGSLTFQRCKACSTSWLPPSPVCRRCWNKSSEVIDASGNARLITWTTYHRVYHASFADSLPYTVGLVELDEGPRLFAGIRTDKPTSLRRNLRLTLSYEPREEGFRVPVFSAVAAVQG